MQPTPFEIPDQMRETAESTVEQARKTFEQFFDAAQKAFAASEGSARSMSDSAAELNRQALAMVEESIAGSFDLARRLVQARTLEEVGALQREYFDRQMKAATEQGKRLGSLMGNVGTSGHTKK